MPQDKDDIENVLGAPSTAPPATRCSSPAWTATPPTAASTAGFWFFQQPISMTANGTFSGIHTDGDLLRWSISPWAAPARFRRSTADRHRRHRARRPPARRIDFRPGNGGPVSVPWKFIDKYGFTSPQAGELLQDGRRSDRPPGANVPRYVGLPGRDPLVHLTTSTLPILPSARSTRSALAKVKTVSTRTS